jgi:hypothetical protein
MHPEYAVAGSIADWVERNKKALGYVAGGAALATAVHLGMDTKMFDGKSIYEMTDSATRFIHYLITSGMWGKALEITFEGKAGRKLTTPEKILTYGLGAFAATGVTEAWENIGSSIDSVHRVLHDTFGDYAKQEFPGKGLESFNDAAKTIVGTQALVAGKEYLSSLWRKFRGRE